MRHQPQLRRMFAQVGVGCVAVLAGGLAMRDPVVRLLAQGPAAGAAPTFEVASVKQNTSGSGLVMLGMQPGGRYQATNVPLRFLIRNAFQIQDSQLVGAPGWVDSDRFDIIAKADPSLLGPPPGGPGSGPAPVQLMLRALLADRFKLAIHTETRELPVYALVLARKDGKLGPQLTPVSAECASTLAARRGGPPRGGPGGPDGRGPAGPPGPPPLPQPGEKMPCGSSRLGPGDFSSGGLAMPQLAQSLSQLVNRIVQDKTELTGTYEANLKWTPDQLPQGRDLPPGFPAIDPNGPSIYTAVQEQLGLKLDSQKAPVDVLVIDRVEHPTED